MNKSFLCCALFFTSLICNSQTNFSDYAKVSNSNLILHYFNTFEFYPEWPGRWSEGNGSLVINGKPSEYKTRVCKKMNGKLFIDSSEYRGYTPDKYEIGAKTHMEIDLAGKVYKRKYVANVGDTGYLLEDFTLKYDNLNRLIYAEYVFGMGYTSNALKANHYKIHYTQNSLIDSITGYDEKDQPIEKLSFRNELNLRDSSLLIYTADSFCIAKINKEGEALKVTNYDAREDGTFAYGREYYNKGNRTLVVYAHYPVGKTEKEILYKETITFTDNQCIISRFNYENYPKETSRIKTELTFDPANKDYLLFKYYRDGKLETVIEQK